MLGKEKYLLRVDSSSILRVTQIAFYLLKFDVSHRTMNWKVIKTEPEYHKALTRTLEIFHALEGTPEAKELAFLLVLVKDYEDKHVRMAEVE